VNRAEYLNDEIGITKLKELDLEACQPQSLSRVYAEALRKKATGLWRKVT
jgi:hypothetical protein